MISKTVLSWSVSFLVAMFSASAMAHDDFTAKIEKIPDGKIGIWIIGGRQVPVTKDTDLDESDGELIVGKCVEVDISQGWVTQIEGEAEMFCD